MIYVGSLISLTCTCNITHFLFLISTLFSNRSIIQQSPDLLTGYVHKVSEIHTPTKSNPYFDFNLQLSPSNVVRGVCYSPEKRSKLKETQQKKIAVTIDNVQASIAKRRASEQEYTIKKKSRITPSTVQFPYNDSFSQTTFPIIDIDDISNYQAINVNAKVLSVGKQSTIRVRGKTLVKVDVIIADETASIKLVLWENNFTLVENNTYAMNDVTVRTFNDSKYLTTTKYSTIIQIDDLKRTAPATAQQYGKTITAKTIAVHLTHSQICPFCNNKIQSPSAASVATKCTGCSLTVLNTQLQNSTLSKFVIQQRDDDAFLNYTARDNVVNTFLQSLDKPTVDKFTELQLIELLSPYPNLVFTVSETDKLISDISL